MFDYLEVVGASSSSTAPITSSFATQHPPLMDWAKTTVRLDEKHLGFLFDVSYMADLMVNFVIPKPICSDI